jgi:hypothetical protein
MGYYDEKKKAGLIGCPCEYGKAFPRDAGIGDEYTCPRCDKKYVMGWFAPPPTLPGAFESGKRR